MSYIRLLAAAVLLLAVITHLQQRAIDSLVRSQEVETHRIAIQAMEIAKLQRELRSHLDTQVKLEHEIIFLSQQSDALMAALRSRRAGYKVIDAWVNK